MRYSFGKKSPFCLSVGKADDTPSPVLPRARNSLLWLRPWSPWIWGILDFRSIRVKTPGLEKNSVDITRPTLCELNEGTGSFFDPLS
jgi:hypothetical protein